VDSLAALLKGGASGPSLVVGKPERSLVVQAVTYEHASLKMPPGGKLPSRDVQAFQSWVRMGAPWGVEAKPGASTAAARAAHWAFQPVRRAALPKVRNTAWVKTPIDAFILAALEKKGLQPAPPADARTLIRRATFDLTGLPPTPEEVDTFLRDCAAESGAPRAAKTLNTQHPTPKAQHPTPNTQYPTPTAYARLIDRLLASQAYGERWGRHWLDVARYADSNGLDENVALGNAWRYRDWVIRCLNEDKPYDQFVMEQVAGDLLVKEELGKRGMGDAIVAPDPSGWSKVPEDLRGDLQQKLTATGFLVLGPKVLAEADKDKMVMDIVDEQIDTTGKAFMGLTLGCARCHDHKFDPVSTKDYYALAGIFKSTRTMESLKTIARWWENPIPSPADLAAQEAHKKRTAELDGQIQAVVKAAKDELAASKPGVALPKELETAFKPETQAELKKLRERLAQVQKEAPEIPTAMGVTDGEIADVRVHVRGDHLTLGDAVNRRFPVILAGQTQPSLPVKQSGRLEMARWLASKDHPLTSRVMVNRVWRWHFGRGLVGSTDNFGILGDLPSHPELLDWLASMFATGDFPSAPGASASPWSLKKLHRLMMLSSTYQQSSRQDPRAAAADPENHLLWRANVQRLDVEGLRDSVLAVADTLDRTMGGSLLHVKNHEFFFDHTSKDGTKYDSKKRAIYLPVVRNNVYDVFQLFDFVDPAVLEGNRPTTTVAPQALFWMNSDLVLDASEALAKRVMASGGDTPTRIRHAYTLLYSRGPEPAELARGVRALSTLTTAVPEGDAAKREVTAWSWYCQTLLAANEFSYLR
jgi:hypothetical protein